MKRCKACGGRLDDQARFCTICGSADLEEIMSNEQSHISSTVSTTVSDGTTTVTNDKEERGNGNILAGAVGAFLFSIIGGALYFLIYQMGIIAGICGLVIFTLANFGYGLFAKTKNKASIAGLICSVLATIAMIYFAEFFCVSFEIYQSFKEFGITIFDAIQATPEFLSDPQIGDAVMEDLTYAYIFGFIATIGNIVSLVKSRKK